MKRKKKPFQRIVKLPIILLEVLIAFALIALCILPLIYPHVFILRSENKFISTVELDHFVNLLYADTLQKLYQNDISWQDIENGSEISIDTQIAENKGFKNFPYIGSYKFSKVIKKTNSDTGKEAYLMALTYTFKTKPGFFLEKDLKDKTPKITYKYEIAIERNQ